MNQFFAEFFGTAMIMVFGSGVVSNVLLSKTKGNNSGWIVISFGWAVGVFTGVLVAADVSGAHLNPAVTLATGPCRQILSFPDAVIYKCAASGSYVRIRTGMAGIQKAF